jgi:hypothetical protein
VIISKVPMMHFEQMLAMNIDRWRGQVELPPAKPEDIAQLAAQPVKVGANEGKLYEFVGAKKRQAVAMAWVGGELWFAREPFK